MEKVANWIKKNFRNNNKSVAKSKERLELKKEFGLMYGITIIMGLMVGGGIYISPQMVFKQVGSPGLSLLMWLFGGLLSFLGAMSFTELGTNYRISGGRYSYLNILCNPFFGFTYFWLFLLFFRPGHNAIKVLLIGRFLLKPFFENCHIPTIAIKFIASFLIVLMCFLNCLSVRLAAKGQSFIIVTTLCILSIISLLGFYYLPQTGPDDDIRQLFKGSTSDPTSLIFGLFCTIYPYAGWNGLNDVIEEVRNPKKNLPKAVAITISSLIILYILVNFAYFVILDRNELFESQAIVISLGLKIWPPLAWIFCLAVSISIVGSLNSGILCGSRITYAAARYGHAPEILCYIHTTRYTPVSAIFIQMLFCLLYIWFLEIEAILIHLNTFEIFADLAILTSLVRFRLKDKLLKTNGFQLPLVVHILYILLLLLLCSSSLIENPVASLATYAIILGASCAFYLLFISYRPAFIRKNEMTVKAYKFLQKLFFSAPPDKMIIRTHL